jgi:hypothetical protein
MKKNEFGLLEDTLAPGLITKSEDVSWENKKIYS